MPIFFFATFVPSIAKWLPSQEFCVRIPAGLAYEDSFITWLVWSFVLSIDTLHKLKTRSALYIEHQFKPPTDEFRSDGDNLEWLRCLKGTESWIQPGFTRLRSHLENRRPCLAYLTWHSTATNTYSPKFVCKNKNYDCNNITFQSLIVPNAAKYCEEYGLYSVLLL